MATRLTTLIVVAIVAATFIAGLIVGAQRDDANGPVDLIIFNGKVYPAGGGRFEEAVAVRGNQILRVGSNREIKRLRRAQTVVLDAHGGAVVPGFNDSHVHFVEGALALDQIDLGQATTPEAIVEEIRAYAEAHPTRSWVLGRGWRSDVFPGGLPTRQALDVAVSDRPVFLTSDDGQHGWANSKALELAGITRRTKSPQRGAIVKDRRSGEPTGVLKNAAKALMSRALPQPSRLEKLMALGAAIGEAHRLGVTSVQTVSADAEELDMLAELRQQAELTLRVYGALAVPSSIKDADVDELDRVRQKYPDDPILKAGAVEIVCAGTHDAAPLPSAREVGEQLPCSPAELERAVTLLDKHQWQVAVHASESADVRAALDAFEHAAAANPEPARGRRHRIEHVETIDPADVPRLRQVGLIAEPSVADVLLLAAPSDEAGAGAVDREPSVWSLIGNAGVRVLFGSDWPATSMDPRLGLERVAVSPPSDTEVSSEVPARPVALPLPAAIDAYTSNASYASYDEHRKGTLAPGMLADIVILSSDIFERPPERVKDSVVDVTIFDGKIVYRRDAQTTSEH